MAHPVLLVETTVIDPKVSDAKYYPGHKVHLVTACTNTTKLNGETGMLTIQGRNT